MAKKENKKSVAKKYADALFSSAKQHNCTDSIYEELVQLIQYKKDSIEFEKFVSAPFVSAKSRVEIMLSIAKKSKASELFSNFLAVLAENERFYLLEDIAVFYKKMLDDLNGLLNVEVVTAVEMTEDTEKYVMDTLKSLYKKTINLTKKIDPDLIGGLTVQVGSEYTDLSIKNKIEKMKLAMKGRNV